MTDSDDTYAGEI